MRAIGWRCLVLGGVRCVRSPVEGRGAFPLSTRPRSIHQKLHNFIEKIATLISRLLFFCFVLQAFSHLSASFYFSNGIIGLFNIFLINRLHMLGGHVEWWRPPSTVLCRLIKKTTVNLWKWSEKGSAFSGRLDSACQLGVAQQHVSETLGTRLRDVNSQQQLCCSYTI